MQKDGRGKIPTSILVGLSLDENGRYIQARINFACDHNRSKQWLAILTTNYGAHKKEKRLQNKNLILEKADQKFGREQREHAMSLLKSHS